MQKDYVKVSCKEDVYTCHTNFAKKMERNLHETINRWKMYEKQLFSEDLEVWDVKPTRFNNRSWIQTSYIRYNK